MTAANSRTLHKQLKGALTRMLSLAGVEIGKRVEGSVLTGPLEPLCDAPPAVWLHSAAFHLADIWSGCASIIKKLDKLANLFASGGPIKDIVAGAWGTVGDVRFHAFLFPLYAELIRDKLLRNEEVEEGLCLWAVRETDYKDVYVGLPVGFREKVLTSDGGLSHDQAERIIRDVEDLYQACHPTCRAISDLADKRRASLSALCESFLAVERVVLQLDLVLLRADVACLLLMYHSSDDNEGLHS